MSSICAVEAAIIGPAARGLAAPQLAAFGAGLACTVAGLLALHVMGRQSRSKAQGDLLRLPLSDPAPMSVLMARLWAVAIGIALFASWGIRGGDLSLTQAALMGAWPVLMSVGAVRHRLFNPDYNCVTFYPEHLKIGERESRRWSELEAQWGAIEEGSQRLGFLYTTPRIRREIALRIPLDQVPEVHALLAAQHCECNGEPCQDAASESSVNA